MLSNKRNYATLARAHVAPGMVIALAVAVGGCSADVTRFDFPSFGLTGNGNQTGSLGTPPDTVARNDRGYDYTPAPPPRSDRADDYARSQASPLPPPRTNERVATRDYASPPPPTTGYTPAPTSERDARRYERAAAPTPPPRAAAPVAGESIQVQQGDTLYGIAKRHNVSISALIDVNGLKSGASIKPGQQLVLPANAAPASRVAQPAPTAHAPTKSASNPPPARTALAARPGWEGRHTMTSGESLYGVARKYGVSLAELQRVNGITEPTSVRNGTVLAVPAKAAAAPEPVAQRAAPPPAVSRTPGAPPAQAKIINAPEHKVASAGNTRSDAEPVAEAPAAAPASGKFRWPARGKLISGFGKRPDGTHNDGINIAVPQGTEVHAAEGGRVAYAGNELKGYGNLVLIRHDNGWVSAYAHADQILVKRDDVVRRGQIIAKAGRTGTVDQPQLHFELRQGAKPVDPSPHMEK